MLPGVGYTPARPLLHFARLALERRDWSVLELWWDYGARPPDASPPEWACAHLEAALDRSPEHALVVGKSLGTLAAALAGERMLPAVWLTPLLQVEPVAAALARASAPALVVCGDADAATPPGALDRLDRAEVVVVRGGDHSLEVGGDPLASVDALRRVVASIDEFAARV